MIRLAWFRGLVAAMALALFCLLATAPKAHAFSGDATYQWWWEKYGCVYTRTIEGGIQTSGQVTGAYQMVAQTVGGNKVRMIRLESWMVGLDDNLRWVKIGTKTDYKYTQLTGKRTEGVRFTWNPNHTISNFSTMPDQVGMVYKISWRRFIGVQGSGFWKTRKKTADLYPQNVQRMAGNLVVGDTKHYMLGETCRTRTQGFRRTDNDPEVDPGGAVAPAAALVTGRSIPNEATGRLAASPRPMPRDSDVSDVPTLGRLAGPTPLPDRSFEGLAAPEAIAATASARSPPDPAIAVGSNRLVVAGGGALNVLDSETGARLSGPTSAASLWGGSGPCATRAERPRLALLYDEHAGRFVAARAVDAPAADAQSLVCLAVSASGDPTGAWHTYQADIGTGFTLEDIRLAAWPNAYLVTVLPSQVEAGTDNPAAPGDVQLPPPPRIVAFGRTAALTGAPAPSLIRSFAADDDVRSVAPADLDAAALTDPAAPALLVAVRTTDVALYRFTVDFGNPAATALSQPAVFDDLPVGSQVLNCVSPCAPQPGADLLDTVPGRVGLRPVVHATSEDTLRLAFAASWDVPYWVDVEDPWGAASMAATGEVFGAAGEVVFQPSVVADSADGLLVANHGSSDLEAPGLRYEAILPDGTSSGQQSATPPGSASQPRGGSFGPDTAAARDPSDPCRIWLAGQNQRTGMEGDWSVRVASLRSPNCPAEANAAPSAEFTLAPGGARPHLTCRSTRRTRRIPRAALSPTRGRSATVRRRPRPRPRIRSPHLAATSFALSLRIRRAAPAR